jgi:uncharacterized protein (UPF0261 family)
VSAIDAPGQPFYDPEADRALFEAIRGGIHGNVKLLEVDAHINDPVFATSLAGEFAAMIGGKRDDVHA